MRKLSIGSLGAVITMAIASVALADAGDHYLATYGGNGGNYFVDNVAHGFMFGLHLRSGSLVDALGWIEQDGQEGATMHGGTGGQEHRTTCPGNYVMYGLYGKSGTMVDRIGPICIRPTDESERTETDYGGFGGSVFNERCTWNSMTKEKAVGLQGRSAASLDQIGLVCNTTPRP